MGSIHRTGKIIPGISLGSHALHHMIQSQIWIGGVGGYALPNEECPQKGDMLM